MSEISYTFLRNNHTKQGRISTWTREQPGTTRKEKMMGDYTEHLISMAGGDGDVSERLDRIQKSNDMWLQSAASDRTDHDIKFLLALVREQAAQIERVEALADEHDRAADNLLHRAEGYIDGEYKSRHLARADEERARAWAIRAALTATGQP